MDREVLIDGKQVKFRATARTPRLYRGIIGRDMIAGLWNGISAKFNSVIAKVKAMASRLPKAVKKVLGIGDASLMPRQADLAFKVVNAVVAAFPEMTMHFYETCHTGLASVAQWIEHRIPVPGARVRLLSDA